MIFFRVPPSDPGGGRTNECGGESDTSLSDSRYKECEEMGNSFTNGGDGD